MEKPKIDVDEWIISLSDVKRLYISIRRRLIKWVFFGGFLAFLYSGIASLKYEAQATFKEGVEKNSPDSAIKDFVMGMSQPQPQAISIMKSSQVLRPLVEKMGLQVMGSKTGWLIPKVIKRFRDNLKAEKGEILEELDPFLFQDVAYEEEQSFGFHIFFTDVDHFIVYAGDKKEEICKGVLGSPVRLSAPPVQFTLAKAPKKVKMDFFYAFHIGHWFAPVAALRDQIKIKNDKENKSIINLSVRHRDRHLAARLVNELMNQYQHYLKIEYDYISKEQLVYLENKQEQICGKMDQLFDQHSTYLVKSLTESGIMGLNQEAQNLLTPHHQMQNKVLALEVELSRLDQMEKEGKVTAVMGEGLIALGLNKTVQQMQELKQQRDLLELSLCQVTECALESRKEELKEIRNQRYSIETLIQEIEKGQEISAFDINPGLCQWAKAIQNPEEREDFADYLENYARILSMREKMLQERFFYGNRTPPELEGIDLPSAKGLFFEYNAKLDKAEASMRHYAEFKKEIPRPDFDLASLGSILKDSLCQKLIAEAGLLELRIKDEKHHSSKEAGRWEEEMVLYRKILMNHLDQLYKVEELNAALIREKMAGLQKVSLDCINRQLSVFHEQIFDSMKQSRQSLLLEKSLLENKIRDIRSHLAAAIPEKWRFEQWLSIKTEMLDKMIGTITEVVESRTIANHLHHVESKPLDCALVPIAVLSPKLRLTTCVGAFVLPFFVFCFAFVQQLFKGFPTSSEKLKALRLPVLGQVSTFCDGPSIETPTGPDLELLRQLAIFAEGGKVISLIGGRGPDYSYALGENLARMATKSIVLRCDFLSKFRKEDAPGLLQVWKEEIGELPIRKGKGFDYITAGGYSPFGTEIVQSQNFTHLVELLKKNYDRVFLFFRTPLSSAESMAALRLCEKAVVTVSGEQIEELTPFVDWAYHEDRCRLTFITRS